MIPMADAIFRTRRGLAVILRKWIGVRFWDDHSWRVPHVLSMGSNQ